MTTRPRYPRWCEDTPIRLLLLFFARMPWIVSVWQEISSCKFQMCRRAALCFCKMNLKDVRIFSTSPNWTGCFSYNNRCCTSNSSGPKTVTIIFWGYQCSCICVWERVGKGAGAGVDLDRHFQFELCVKSRAGACTCWTLEGPGPGPCSFPAEWSDMPQQWKQHYGFKWLLSPQAAACVVITTVNNSSVVGCHHQLELPHTKRADNNEIPSSRCCSSPDKQNIPG